MRPVVYQEGSTVTESPITGASQRELRERESTSASHRW
jgi:hypothetical protein